MREIVFIIVLIASFLTGTPGDAQSWLAFGDLRGHFEPCGCDPATDLGGLPRLDAYLSRERYLHPGVVVFHLGNAYSNLGTTQQDQKNLSIQSALSVVAPDLSLLNRTELLAGAKLLPSIKYVLSNHSSRISSALKYFPSVDLGDSTVYGFVEPFSGYKGLESFDFKAWKAKDKSRKSKEGKKWILLYSGSPKLLDRIVKINVFSTIISSNDWPLEKEFGDEERRSEKRLVAASVGSTEVLKVPLGGQGVLRSPALQSTAPAQPLASALKSSPLTSECKPDLFGKSVDCSKTSTPKNLLSRVFVAWLGKDQESGISEDMKKVISNSRDAAASAMKAHVEKKTEEYKTTNFVGAESCKSCHEDSYNIWQRSKHGHAFATIKSAARDGDPECVSCHVLGFHDKGGFVSEKVSPAFVNVQCENCHGPRKDHLLNPTFKSGFKAKDACASCHTPPHSPRFEMKAYWKMIEHR